MTDRELIEMELNDRFIQNKRYLKRYSKILQRINRLEMKLARIDEKLYSVKSPTLTDMPRGGPMATLDDALMDKEETAERINQMVKESVKIRREIYRALDTLEDYRQAEILEMFFISDMSMDDIADTLGYSVRHTIRLYKDGLLLMSVTCQ